MATDPNQQNQSQVQYYPGIPVTKSNAPSGKISEDAIKQLREYARALMTQRSGTPFGTWGGIGQGLENASGKIMGALADREANEREQIMSQAAKQGGYQQGYTDKTDDRGAAGGASAAAPFPSSPASSKTSGASQPQEATPTHGQQPLGVQTAALDPSSGVAESAMRLSARGETGKDIGMGALFNISPDTGGSKSYGPFGLNSKTKSAQQFVKEHPELGFTTEPGTPEFGSEWNKISASNKEGMRAAHIDWHKKHIMDGLSDSMTKAGVDKKIADDPRVQTYMADRKLQMGTAGLNTALMYGKLSNSPEEFIRRVSQADSQRIPYNFKSYLRENPDNVRGLQNRIDLRHNTALAMADPDTTGKMIDYYRGSSANGGQPPVQVAQNAPQFQNPGLAPGRLQEETSRHINDLVNAGYTYPRALEIAKQAEELRLGTMPKYGEPQGGVGFKTEPGKQPTPYFIPGVGAFQPMPGTPLNIYRYYDKEGVPHERIITPEVGPQSQTAPGQTTPSPTIAPAKTTPQPSQGVTVQAPTAAPTTPQAPPAGGPLVTAPPTKSVPQAIPQAIPQGSALAATKLAPEDEKFQNEIKVASTDLRGLIGGASKPLTVAEEKQAEEAAGAGEGGDWKKFVDEARAKPRISSAYEMDPMDVIGLTRRAQAGDELARRQLLDYQNVAKEKGVYAGKQDAEYVKEYAGLGKAIHDGGVQGRKLQHTFDLAKRIIDMPNFESGKFAGLTTDIRNMAGEFKRAVDRQKNPDGSPKFPAIKKAIDSFNFEKASPNEAFVKIVSGAVLMSLRSMLGTNAGQFRQYEMILLEKAFGNPDLSLEGNKVVMDMINRLNNRSIVYDKMRADYLTDHKMLDANFDKALDNYSEKHPVWNKNEYDDLLSVSDTGKTKKESNQPGPTRGGGPLTTTPPPALQDPLGIRKK